MLLTPPHPYFDPPAASARPRSTSAASDDAIDVIDAVLRLAPAPHWRFARFASDRTADWLASSDPVIDRDGELAALRSEEALQRKRARTGPRIAESIVSIAAEIGATSLTVIFADRRTCYGIMILVRPSADETWTQSERSTLALAVEPLSDTLAHPGPARRRTMAAAPRVSKPDRPSLMYLLDASFNVVLTMVGGSSDAAPGRPVPVSARPRRLSQLVEAAVREMVASWQSSDREPIHALAVDVASIVVRAQPLEGGASGRPYIGVVIEAQDRFPLARAAEEFALSQREAQVLRLVLDGARLVDICQALHLASSTVQEYLKNLLAKTRSSNRSEMISKVLGWV